MPAPPPPLVQRVTAQRLITELRWHRRSIAAAIGALALLAAVSTAAPRDDATVPVLVAARDLPAGARLAPEDLRPAQRSPAELPDAAFTPADAPVGRVVALPVRTGEVLTDVRLLGSGLLERLGVDVVAAPVHLADASAAGIVQVGDVVDVLASGEAGHGSVAAPGARVLAAPSDQVVVVAVTSRTASRLASSAATARLSLVIRADDGGPLR